MPVHIRWKNTLLSKSAQKRLRAAMAVVILVSVSVLVFYFSTRPKKISIIALGDIMLGRHVAELMATGVDPFQYIRFDNKSFPIQSNLVIANLEGPITTTIDCQVKAYSFKFDPSVAKLLKARGIDAVSQANNHSQDCFRRGFDDTQKYLKQAGVTYFGGWTIKDMSKEIVVDGTHVALVGLDMTVSPPPTNTVYSLIKTLKTHNQYVIVNIHWGDEYSPTENAQQKSVAHKLIDAGVDVVVGEHPHVIEPIETYKGKTIFYSLGNFIFDQTDPETRKGMLVYLTLSDDGTQTYKTYSYTIQHAQPKLDN